MTSPEIQRRLGFVHRFVPAKRIARKQATTTTTLLLLHGTGGNEDDLLPLGQKLDPDAALLSPRGKILEDGRMPRFFRRLAEGVLDIDDLRYRTNELADFVKAASDVYGFDAGNVVAVGYCDISHV